MKYYITKNMLAPIAVCYYRNDNYELSGHNSIEDCPRLSKHYLYRYNLTVARKLIDIWSKKHKQITFHIYKYPNEEK